MTQAEIATILAAFNDFKTAVTSQLAVIQSENDASEKVHDDHEGRIRGIERVVQRVLGLGAVATLIVGGCGGALLSHLWH